MSTNKVFNLRLPKAVTDFRIPSRLIRSTWPVGLTGGAVAALLVNFGLLPCMEQKIAQPGQPGLVVVGDTNLKKYFHEQNLDIVQFQPKSTSWNKNLSGLLAARYKQLMKQPVEFIAEPEGWQMDAVQIHYASLLKDIREVDQMLDGWRVSPQELVEKMVEIFNTEAALRRDEPIECDPEQLSPNKWLELFDMLDTVTSWSELRLGLQELLPAIEV